MKLSGLRLRMPKLRTSCVVKCIILQSLIFAHFIDHIHEVKSNIVNENKIAFILGDFSITLLNYRNDSRTGNFLNGMFL